MCGRSSPTRSHATEGIEYTRFGQWKFDPSTAPTTAPDLAESRTAIDGFNKTMVDEIALQWDSLHGPACSTELRGATDAVANARGLDPLYRQALSSATQSYCALYLSSRDIRRSASTLPPV